MAKKELTDRDYSGNNLYNSNNMYGWDSPGQHGLLEYNFPPQVGSIANAFTTQRIYGISFIAQTSKSVGHVAAGVTAVAATPTSGQNLIGLYSISGTTATQQAITGDLSTWTGGGFNSYAFGSAFTLTQGSPYLILMLSNATTPVKLVGLSSTAQFPALYNGNCSNTAAPWYKFFVQTSSGATGLPSSFTISATTMSVNNALTPWVGLLT